MTARAGEATDLGMELADATPDLKRRFDLPERLTGALVTGVTPGSLAERAGLRPGVVIVEIDRRPVRNAVEAKRLLAHDAIKKGVLVRIADGNGNRFIVLSEE
jgi:serine protease Do